MRCEDFIRLLDPLVDGALDEAQRAEMEAHARDCPACAAELRTALQLQAMLKSLPEEADVPLAAQAGWRKAVRAESKRAGRRRYTRMIAAAAAVLVALLAVRLAKPPARAPKLAENAAVQADEVAYEADEAAEAVEEAEAPMLSVASSAGKSAEREAVAEDAMDLEEDAADFEEAFVESAEGENFTYDAAAPMPGDAAGADDADGEDAAFAGEVSLAADSVMAAGNAASAELHAVTIRVEDAASAGRSILDTALEFDGEATLSDTEDGAQLEATLSAEDARELLEAVRQWDENPDGLTLPELAGEARVTLLIHIAQR